MHLAICGWPDGYDGLNVFTGGMSYASSINYVPNSTNTYLNDEGIVGLSDVESSNSTYFLFQSGTTIPNTTPGNGNVVPNNFYNIDFQTLNVVNPPNANSTSFEIQNFSSDCIAVSFVGLYFQEADAICNECVCDENEIYCFPNINVTASDTWTATSNPGFGVCPNNILTIEGELILQPGVTLTMNGVQIRFGPNGKIVVKRGNGTDPAAHLIIENNTILNSIDNFCMWQGIEVWGYANQGDVDQQGRLILKESHIINAHVGVYMGHRTGSTPSSNLGAYTGGQIELLQLNEFLNNAIGVEFPFSYFYGTIFSIDRNDFICDRPLIDPIYNGSRSIYHIDVNRHASRPVGTSYLGIFSNTFRNTPSNWNNSTVGVRMFGGRSIPILNNFFEDVDRGIFLLSSGSFNYMKENEFRNCNIGIYNLNNTYSQIIGNIFDFGIRPNNMAILNQTAKGTMIFSNEIDRHLVGINVLRSGNNIQMPVDIIKNTIDRTPFSLDAGGNNFYTTWNCNEMDNYNAGQAWSIFDYNSLGKIRTQGRCGSGAQYPASNQFLLVNPDPTLDIRNDFSSSPSNFIYNINTFSNPIFVPDVISSNVSVNSCATGITESQYCSTLILNRNIRDLLAERDTVTDSLYIGSLNNQIVQYYINNEELDSLIDYFDTMGTTYSDPILFPIYDYLNNIDSMRSIISRWPTSTDEMQNLKDFYEIYCNIYEDSSNFYEMDEEEIDKITDLALGNDEASELAKSVLYALNEISMDISCDMVNLCESRYASFMNKPTISNRIISNSTLIPNPASDFTTTLLSNKIEGNLTIEFQNSFGQLVEIYQLNKEDSYRIKLDKLKNGVYLYTIKANNKCIGSGKLVVIH